MTEMTLREYVNRHGQVRAGKTLGVTQMAISKALISGRNINVSIGGDGEVEAIETKPFPGKKKTTQD